MIVTAVDPLDPKKKINFQMSDHFDEAVIRREAKKIINERFKDLRDQTHGHYELKWKY